jgi:hypothetical protein
MGGYTSTEKPRRSSRSYEQQTSTRINRGQRSDRNVGPSGKEWIKGDDFLDACTCTTNCKCRKSQRVLYRSKNNRKKGAESDSEETTYDSGEIRYILRDDLGRDCGDHSGCKKSDTESEKTTKRKKGKRKEEKPFEGFKEELLDALDERFQNMKKETQQRDKSGSPSRSPFGRPAMGTSPFGLYGANMDPRVAQQMGMGMGGDPYGIGMAGMGRMPHGLSDPLGGRSMRPPGRPRGGMAAAGMGFEDEISMADLDGIGPGNPYAPGNMINRGSIRPDLLSPLRARTGADFGGMDMGRSYSKAMRARDGMMQTRRMGKGGRRPHSDSNSDDFNIGILRRAGMQRRRNGGEAESPLRGMTDAASGLRSL